MIFENKKKATLILADGTEFEGRAFGADGLVVKDIGQLAGALTEAVATEASTVIAVPMDRLPSPF